LEAILKQVEVIFKVLEEAFKWSSKTFKNWKNFLQFDVKFWEKSEDNANSKKM